MRTNSIKPATDGRAVFSRFLTLAKFLAATLLCEDALAATKTWTGAAGNTWGVTQNWNPLGEPGSLDDARIDSGGTAELIGGAGQAYSLFMGSAGSGNLHLSSGAVMRTMIAHIGEAGGATGPQSIATVEGPGTQWLGPATAGSELYELHVGESGNGSLYLLDGASITSSYSGIAFQPGSKGTAVLNHNAVWNNSHVIEVGTRGNGSLDILDASQVSADWMGIASDPNSVGNVKVAGANSRLTMNGSLVIGYLGNGTLRLESGAFLKSSTVWGGDVLGNETNGRGEAFLSGNSTWETWGIAVGGRGAGFLNILGARLVTTNDGTIGSGAGGSGEATVTGPNSTWTNRSLHVGLSGTGILKINGGASVESTGARSRIASGGATNGTVEVNGVGSKWLNHKRLEVGSAFASGTSAGILDIKSGGLVEVGATLDQSEVSLQVWNNGQINVTDANSRLVVANGDPGSVPAGQGVFVGGAGAVGRMEISGGGKVTNFDGHVKINGPQGTSTSVTGAGSSLQSSSLIVGNDDHGQLDITAGGNVESNFLEVGASRSLFSPGIGVVNVNNGKLAVFSSGIGEEFADPFIVGRTGNGTLNILNGGEVTHSDMTIGGSGILFSGTGTVTVDGSNSKLTSISGSLRVGWHGTGTLNITNGAHVQNSEGLIGYETDSVGTVVVGQNAVWDNEHAVAIGNFGQGLLDLRGGAVNCHNLVVGSGGSIVGNGTINGHVVNRGTSAPGASPGTIHINGDYTQESTGKLKIELASNSLYDVLDVTGNTSLGGALEISLLSGFVPAPTQTFNFLNSGSHSGAFSNVTVTSPSGPAGTFTLTPTATGLALSNFQPDPSYGLVAHWNAENGATDVTGNGHDGIFQGNAATVTAGPHGKAFTFDGSGDFINIGDELDMGTSDFTLSAWINGDPTMNQWGRILDKGFASGYAFGKVADSNRVGFEYLASVSQGNTFGTTTSVIDNVWRHVALVKSGNTVTMYANGVAQNSATVSAAMQDNALPLLIGFNPGQGTQGYWKGLLDELKVYNRALGASEIATMAGPQNTGPIAYWNAENGAADATGNGHDGIFQGNAATITSGPFGKAFTFDGSGDFINIGDELDMGASDFTLSAWVQGDPTMSQWARIFDKGYSTAYELGRTDTSSTIGFTFKSSMYADSSSNLIDGTWHHVAVVKQGETAMLYADGDLERTISVTPALQENALSFLIGYNPGEGIQGFWKGLLDELRIYSRALSAAEIATLATIITGDFNNDGQVDTADYVVWRKTGIYGQQGYDAWRANYGKPTASASANNLDSSAVPELTSLLLLAIAAATVAPLGRARARR